MFTLSLAALVLVHLSVSFSTVSASPAPFFRTSSSNQQHYSRNVQGSRPVLYNTPGSSYGQRSFNNKPNYYEPQRNINANLFDELLSIINSILGTQQSTANARRISFVLQPSIEIPFDNHFETLYDNNNGNNANNGFVCQGDACIFDRPTGAGYTFPQR